MPAPLPASCFAVLRTSKYQSERRPNSKSHLAIHETIVKGQFMGNTITLPTLEYEHPLPTQPPDSCPHVSPAMCLSECEGEKCAENMTDVELVRHVESKLRPLGKELRSIVPFLREARDRFAHPGGRVPISGQPTFTEWSRQTIGVSDRHIRRLLAEAREPADRSCEDETVANSK